MTARRESIADVYPRAVAAGRTVAAVLVSGALAGLVWMFVLQEAHTGRIFGATWTDHDFPDGLGHLFGADDTAHAGLYLTLGLGVLAALLFALIERFLPGRGVVKGLPFAAILFALWALVFTPLVDSRQVLVDADFAYLPTGFFGMEAGRATPVAGIVASLATGLLIARILPMMRGAAWWEPHPEIDHWGEVDSPDLLELPEQRPEQGVERAG